MKQGDDKYPEWWRRRALYKQALFSTWKGRVVVKGWQKPRGPPVSEAQAKTQTDFLKLVDAQKNAWPVDQVGSRLIAANTQYAWRDVIARAACGRLIEFIIADESIKLVPQMQELLDTINATPGAMLIRTDTEWIGIQPGSDGTVLTWVDAFNTAFWVAPPQQLAPLVAGDLNLPTGTDQYPGLIITPDNQVVMVPV